MSSPPFPHPPEPFISVCPLVVSSPSFLLPVSMSPPLSVSPPPQLSLCLCPACLLSPHPSLHLAFSASPTCLFPVSLSVCPCRFLVVSCAVADLQAGPVVAVFPPAVKDRVGVGESSEESHAAPGHRELHLHSGWLAAVPQRLSGLCVSHLSRLPASPLAHGGFFPHFHPRRQEPLRTVD